MLLAKLAKSISLFSFADLAYLLNSASYSVHVEFRNKRLWTNVFNNNRPFCQLIKIIACKKPVTRRFRQYIQCYHILPLSRFPLSIYRKFFYMQTKRLSNNMPTRRVLIEIPHSNNRPIQSTILLQQPHCKRNKVCKIYRHGWRTPRFLSAYIRSRHKLLLHFTKYWVAASTTILFITRTKRRLIAEPRELHNDMRVRRHVRDINTLGYKYLYIISWTFKLYTKSEI